MPGPLTCSALEDAADPRVKLTMGGGEVITDNAGPVLPPPQPAATAAAANIDTGSAKRRRNMEPTNPEAKAYVFNRQKQPEGVARTQLCSAGDGVFPDWMNPLSAVLMGSCSSKTDPPLMLWRMTPDGRILSGLLSGYVLTRSQIPSSGAWSPLLRAAARIPCRVYNSNSKTPPAGITRFGAVWISPRSSSSPVYTWIAGPLHSTRVPAFAETL